MTTPASGEARVRCVEGQTCPHCGGIHYGSLYCPYSGTAEPAAKLAEVETEAERAERIEQMCQQADATGMVGRASSPAEGALRELDALPNELLEAAHLAAQNTKSGGYEKTEAILLAILPWLATPPAAPAEPKQ